MRTLISLLVMVTMLAGAGCAGKHRGEQPPRESRLANLPFVYRMTVQQGNIISEEMLDQLQLGMSKPQVQYVLGTAMLEDMFHTNRWDYTYTIRRGHKQMEIKALTVWFENDQLIRIDGREPNPERAQANAESREIIVSVPDWEEKRGLIGRSLNAVGLNKTAGAKASPIGSQPPAPDLP